MIPELSLEVHGQKDSRINRPVGYQRMQTIQYEVEVGKGCSEIVLCAARNLGLGRERILKFL